MTTLLAATLWIIAFFDGVPLHCLVDTGANMTIVSATSAAQLGTLGPTRGTVLLRTVTGEIISGERRFIPNIGIKDRFGWSGGEIVVLLDAKFPWGCILGTDFLSQQPIVIDWQRGEIRPMAAEGP